jgi:hypothetical protein
MISHKCAAFDPFWHDKVALQTRICWCRGRDIGRITIHALQRHCRRGMPQNMRNADLSSMIIDV